MHLRHFRSTVENLLGCGLLNLTRFRSVEQWPRMFPDAELWSWGTRGGSRGEVGAEGGAGGVLRLMNRRIANRAALHCSVNGCDCGAMRRAAAARRSRRARSESRESAAAGPGIAATIESWVRRIPRPKQSPPRRGRWAQFEIEDARCHITWKS